MKKFLWFVSIVSLLYGIGFNQYLLFDLFGIEYQRDPNGSEVMVAFYFGCPALILSIITAKMALRGGKWSYKNFLLYIPSLFLICSGAALLLDGFF